MLLAACAWSVYSWLLSRSSLGASMPRHWALFAQINFGILWSAAFAGGEWLGAYSHIEWGWQVALALVYVALGPSILAFLCWVVGVQRVGPNIAAFFSNLTPLFAALLSLIFLGELPHFYHTLAFLLIVAGIALSARHH